MTTSQNGKEPLLAIPPTPEEMSSLELEVLFWAASSIGTNAGHIKWALPWGRNLQAGSMSWSFGSDSAREGLYWEAVKNLVRYGYAYQVGTGEYGEYVVTALGHQVAEDCCHEWWRREFAKVREHRSKYNNPV